ncbi:MAG: hypothetical protein H7834_10815 [Magnetococcus sp. YQC-9]
MSDILNHHPQRPVWQIIEPVGTHRDVFFCSQVIFMAAQRMNGEVETGAIPRNMDARRAVVPALSGLCVLRASDARLLVSWHKSSGYKKMGLKAARGAFFAKGAKNAFFEERAKVKSKTLGEESPRPSLFFNSKSYTSQAAGIQLQSRNADFPCRTNGGRTARAIKRRPRTST